MYTLMKADADRKYTPDYDTLISNAKTRDEADFLCKAKASKTRFMYNLIYVIRCTCGHHQISQANCGIFDLNIILDRARKYAETSKCAGCLLESEYKSMQEMGIR